MLCKKRKTEKLIDKGTDMLQEDDFNTILSNINNKYGNILPNIIDNKVLR